MEAQYQSGIKAVTENWRQINVLGQYGCKSINMFELFGDSLYSLGYIVEIKNSINGSHVQFSCGGKIHIFRVSVINNEVEG